MAGETKSKGQKDKNDKFYTDPAIAAECIKAINLDKYDMIVEPSAGNGSFSSQIENCYAYDIEPEGEGIIQADWFTLNKTHFKGKVLVIGNPPFGQQNTLAIRFFNEAAAFSTTIAFILPLSFKKASIQNQLDLNFHLVKEIELPEKSFLLNGEKYSVPTVFQIWERQIIKRKKTKLKTTTNLFDFVSKDEADFRIQRVGGNAGKASFELNYSANSNYFIKNKSDMSNEAFVSFINSLVFPSIEYTVGPKSLSKGELIEVIENNLMRGKEEL